MLHQSSQMHNCLNIRLTCIRGFNPDESPFVACKGYQWLTYSLESAMRAPCLKVLSLWRDNY